MSRLPNDAEETCLKTATRSQGARSNQENLRLNHKPSRCIEKDQTAISRPSSIAAEERAGNPSGHRNNGDEDDDFPEGGLQAWLVVFGSFCALFIVFGIVNSTGAFNDYLSSNQLRGYSSSQVGWIFSFQLFLVFFCGIYAGRIFDVHGPRLLVALGSVASVLSMMLLSFCTEYWHFMLDYAVLGGIGGALLMTPAYASINHWFKRRRGNATGIAATSGSIGGIVIPIVLQNLFPQIGFVWSTRVLGFLLLAMAIPANLFIAKRVSPPKETVSIIPDFTVFKNLSYALCTAGVFLMEWGLFIPITYISSYTTTHGQETSFGFTALALLNAGSFFGRWVPGLLADRIGSFNVMIMMLLLCATAVLAMWLPAANSRAMIVIFALTIGFASGSNISLIPVCLSRLCPLEHYGRYFSASYFIASFGTLTSIPIGGQLLVVTDGAYWGLIVFAGLAYLGALSSYIASRVVTVGWNPKTHF